MAPRDVILFLFGEGTELAAWQMADRAAVVFVLALVLLRASGRRALGQHSAFDSCTTVLFGAILSRAVVGASPFWPTVAAAATIVLLHRVVALASVRWAWFEALVSGRKRELVRAGRPDGDAMRKALVSCSDLEEAVRKKTGVDDVTRARRAVLERDGTITVATD